MLPALWTNYLTQNPELSSGLFTKKNQFGTPG